MSITGEKAYRVKAREVSRGVDTQMIDLRRVASGLDGKIKLSVLRGCLEGGGEEEPKKRKGKKTVKRKGDGHLGEKGIETR